MSPTRSDEWIDDDEYPDERDMDDFGDDSAPDHHPLTIGRVGNVNRPRFWTASRIIPLTVLILFVIVFILQRI